MSSLLVVEDEAHIANGLRFNLEAEGYTVKVVGDGESALDLLLTQHAAFDAMVLDVMLPRADGFDVARQLRQHKHYIPVLMLTARGRPEDVLKGFEAGADDYLPKPFELAILLARVRGLLRRNQWTMTNPAIAGTASEKPAADARRKNSASSAPPAPASSSFSRPRQQPEDVFRFNGKAIDFGALELQVGSQVLRLTLMEAELLRYLVRNAGKIVSRKSILEDVWGVHEDTDTRAIDNFIVRLRKYIEKEPSRPQHLLTVRGVGYRFIGKPELKPAKKKSK